jgi:mannose-1-phosphate guanylyltransferase
MKAMILAAGLGTRMAPLSNALPKPALPILDEPMILGMVRELSHQGIDSVIVNTHAHPERLEAALCGAPVRVLISREPSLLGSAGGIWAARRHLQGSEPFLVLNADMRVELDVAELHAVHRAAGSLATLLLRDDPRKQHFGTIGYSREAAVCRVCRITDRITVGLDSGSGLFTGVQMMDPSIFAEFSAHEVAQLMPDVYVPLLRSGKTLTRTCARCSSWHGAVSRSRSIPAHACKARSWVRRGSDPEPRSRPARCSVRTWSWAQARWSRRGIEPARCYFFRVPAPHLAIL